MNKFFVLSVVLLTSFKSHALIDYSDVVPVNEEKKSTNNSFQKISNKPSSDNGSRGLAWKSDLSFTSHYESMEIKGEKYGVLKFDTHVQTPANIFFNASYWHAQTGKTNSSGNPKLVLGFNWLKFGSPSDEAKLDLYAGVKLKSNSLLGSSRTDKVFGIETTKRFGTFGLGIGYDLTMVGRAGLVDEMAIGNINRLVVSGGWMVSQDIQFELELENFKVTNSSDTGVVNRLKENVSFSTFSPKLNLGLAPAINLEMGARYRIKKAQESANLINGRVFDLNGANANSLFAGLNLTI